MIGRQLQGKVPIRGRRDRIFVDPSGRFAVRIYRSSLSAVFVLLSLSAVSAQPAARAPVQTVAGMPPVVDAANLYSESGPGKFSPATAGALSRVHFPNTESRHGSVIDAREIHGLVP